MKFKIFTSCNCFDKWMIDSLLDSVITARRFVNRDDIELAFHAPLVNLDEIDERFSPYCNINFYEDTLTTEFAIHPSQEGSSRWYGERLRVKNVKDKNVLLLDADTLVLKDPTHLFEGDFDFASCPKDTMPRHWQHTSNQRMRAKRVFKLPYDRTHIWGGPQIFKNNAHKKIGDEWLRVMEKERHLMDICSSPNRKTYDQLSLTPAVARSDLKIKILKPWDDIFFRCSYADVEDMRDTVTIAHGNDLIDKLGLRKEIEKLKNEIRE